MADTDRASVDAIYGGRGMSDSDADSVVSIANRMVDDVFGGTTGRLGEIEGNEKDMKTYVAAALWRVREGEAQSESQTGGSVSYNFNTPSEFKTFLQNLNEFGVVAAGYIRTGGNYSVEIA